MQPYLTAEAVITINKMNIDKTLVVLLKYFTKKLNCRYRNINIYASLQGTSCA